MELTHSRIRHDPVHSYIQSILVYNYMILHPYTRVSISMYTISKTASELTLHLYPL